MKEKKVILHLRARAKVILQKASKSYITGGGGGGGGGVFFFAALTVIYYDINS